MCRSAWRSSRRCSPRSTSPVASSSRGACSRCSGSNAPILDFDRARRPRLCRGGGALHPRVARALQPADCEAWQHLRRRRHGDRDRHADDAVDVATLRSLLAGEPAQREDEEHRRHDIGEVDERDRNREWEHYFLNIASMRRVTMKPPAMLIVANSVATSATPTDTCSSPRPLSKPPTTMMPLIAFVTLISGVCNAGVTFHTTWKPTNTAITNTVRCCSSSVLAGLAIELAPARPNRR